MAVSNNMEQHLEMMIQKRNRCEDWVASVALRTQVSAGKTPKYIDIDFLDEYSERSVSDESVKRRQRKVIRRPKLPLNLVCEWHKCSFSVANLQSTFFMHMKFHADQLTSCYNDFEIESYRCEWESCNFETVEENQMKRHISYHGYHTLLKSVALHLHDLWQFPPCKLENENRNLLPDLSNPFECGAMECGVSSHHFPFYLTHVNEHLYDLKFSPKSGTQVRCFWKGCAYKCRTLPCMRLHLKAHTGEKVAACSTCGAMFATNTKYMDHCTRKTPILDESNRCQYCLRYFSNERLLRDHLRYHINRHKCPFCEITCSTAAVLANHIRYKHLRDRPFKCADCSYQSVKADDCVTHMSTHDAEPKYKCQAEGCTFACAALQTFKNHFRRIHLIDNGPMYCCHLCNMKYKRGTLLGKHLRKVHKLERPPGHSRFRYMEGVDNNYKLQVERYESIEVDEVEVPFALVPEELPNFLLKYENTDEGSCPKFTISVDDYQESSKGALISIEEIDEEGRIVRTSTIREGMVETPSPDIIFVDVNGDFPDPISGYCEENTLHDTVSKAFPCEGETNPSSKSELQRQLYHVRKKRRKGCQVALSDVDHERNEIILKNNY